MFHVLDSSWKRYYGSCGNILNSTLHSPNSTLCLGQEKARPKAFSLRRAEFQLAVPLKLRGKTRLSWAPMKPFALTQRSRSALISFPFRCPARKLQPGFPPPPVFSCPGSLWLAQNPALFVIAFDMRLNVVYQNEQKLSTLKAAFFLLTNKRNTIPPP